jgi:hypothetical protein
VRVLAVGVVVLVLPLAVRRVYCAQDLTQRHALLLLG